MTSARPTLAVVTPTQFANKRAWVDALRAIMDEMAPLAESDAALAALAPIAAWATRARNEHTLARVAQELAEIENPSPGVRVLAIRARSVLAAAPHRPAAREGRSTRPPDLRAV